jgi:hypothetical protein
MFGGGLEWRPGPTPGCSAIVEEEEEEEVDEVFTIEVSGFCHGAGEAFTLLGCYAAYVGSLIDPWTDKLPETLEKKYMAENLGRRKGGNFPLYFRINKLSVNLAGITFCCSSSLTHNHELTGQHMVEL